MFGFRKSYKSVVDDVARKALGVNFLTIPGLDQPREDIGGYMFNALEWIAAVLFLSQRSLLVIGDDRKFEMARDRLASDFFIALETEYSKREMRSLVLPLLEKQHVEYEAILEGPGTPDERINRLGEAMIGNFVDGQVDELSILQATSFMVETLMIIPGRELKALIDDDKIRW